jgi:hypothetical protein
MAGWNETMFGTKTHKDAQRRTKTSSTKSKVTTDQVGEYLKRLNWNNFKEIPEESRKEGLVVRGWVGKWSSSIP